MKTKRVICFVMCLFVLTGFFWRVIPEEKAEAAQRITIKQAKALALSESTTYSKLISKEQLKQVAYSSAVKALQLKVRHKTTFSWSPLLSFHFPEQLNLEEASEFELKPIFLTNEITEIRHQREDTVFASNEKICNLYVEAYTLQEKIKFQEKQLENTKATLEINKARLAINQATRKDVDSIEKSISTLEKSLAGNKRKFDQKKTKIKNLIYLDVTSGYTFVNPYITQEIPRSQLNYFINYTLEHDHEYYVTRMNTSAALLTLDTNTRLMKDQYGDKMNIISGYISSVRAGYRININSFKSSFDRFVKEIDDPWTGKKRICLFIKVPREWFKGETDGVRYIEDEPYELYNNALEYQDALKDEQQMKVDLTDTVKDSFENIVTARNAYLTIEENIAEKKKTVDEMKIQNSLGEVTFEEYTEEQNEYEELQLQLYDAYETYTTSIYSFDRLTCGAVSVYLSQNTISSDHATGGTSFVVEQLESEDDAKYFISPVISDNMFEFGIYIPEDYETDVTDYELYVNGYKVGNKTPADKTIRHMAFALDSTPKAYVRLYSDDEAVADCEIDASQYEGSLSIPGQFVVKDARKTIQVGTYTNLINDSNLCEIGFVFEKAEKIAFYSIINKNGKAILTDTPIKATSSFKYLSFMSASLDSVTIKCYDSNKNYLYDAFFRTTDLTVYKLNNPE